MQSYCCSIGTSVVAFLLSAAVTLLVLVCSAVLQGRIEHQTVQVPCSNPAACASTSPFSISSLLPWSRGNSSSTTCGEGEFACATCGEPLSSPCGEPQGGYSQSTPDAFSTPNAFSCSAIFDSSTAGSCSTTSAASGGGSVLAGTEGGVMTVERDVVLPGCPMNAYPGKNIDNHLCIMCGESWITSPAVQHTCQR